LLLVTAPDELGLNRRIGGGRFDDRTVVHCASPENSPVLAGQFAAPSSPQGRPGHPVSNAQVGLLALHIASWILESRGCIQEFLGIGHTGLGTGVPKIVQRTFELERT